MATGQTLDINVTVHIKATPNDDAELNGAYSCMVEFAWPKKTPEKFNKPGFANEVDAIEWGRSFVRAFAQKANGTATELPN
jgi:hypothetical protein